ncbi:MAG: N-acetylmuramoyl-L-alanine amidase [Bacteroidota bacterium]|nr:N-acetylmuramoyl-L-alanine amidase [Bacteroidota bacterium]
MKNKRNIKFIVIHCTATQPNAKLENIQKYWKEVKGWKDVPGYHYIIKTNGEVVKLLDENKNSYGVYAHNNECISLSYIGGIDASGKAKDTRTRKQETAMFDKIVELTERYPEAKVVGHRDFAGVKKACPSFDVKTWLSNYTPDLDIAA